MSEDNESLIREIQEEVRREKLKKLWNDYGTWMIAAVIGFVLLVGGWQWYSAYRLDQAQKAGARFEEAVSLLQGDKKAETAKDGIAILENLAREGAPGYASLAKLRLAAAHREAGETDKALALYEAVDGDTSTDQLLRSFASLQIASLKVDTGTWTDVENRLNQLASDSGPWRHSARELLGLAAVKHEKWSQAKQAYTTLLADASVPAAIRQRAETALALITREEEAATAGGDAAKPDLKKDKSAGDDDKSKVGAGGTKPAASSEAGAAENESEPKKQ